MCWFEKKKKVPKGSKCVLVGASVSFWGWALGVSFVQASLSVALRLLPVVCKLRYISLDASPSPYLYTIKVRMMIMD